VIDAFEAGGWEEVSGPRPPGAPARRRLERYPRVVNVRNRRISPGGDLILVTRRTPWGNPHLVRTGAPDSRRGAIARFRRDVAFLIRARPGYLEELRRDLGGADLGCACLPLPCHARTLVAAANSKPGGVLE
jgi:hypothetical protein